MPSEGYAAVPSRGDPHDDSATEVSVSLLDESAKEWDSEGHGHLHRQGRRRPPSGRRRWGCALILTAASAVLNTLLLLAVLLLLAERQHGKPNRYEGAGDLTGFAPQFSQQITTFAPDDHYTPANMSDFFSPAVHKQWLSLVPEGLGYLRLDHPERYDNLPTPLEGFNSTVFTTSMTHQLHCLHSIAETFAALTTEGRTVPGEMVWHLGHCFDYLRQSIMCCGDVALEGQQTTFPPGFTGSDGWDAKHVCKDYGQVYRYLQENRADDEVWI